MALRGVKKYVHSIREKSGATLLERQNCHPWAVTATNINIANKTAKIKIAPGSINGVVPSNIKEEFPVTNDGTTYYIYCSVVASNGAVQTCQLAVSTSPPSGFGVGAEIPPRTFEVFIGSWCYGKYNVTKENIFLEVYEIYKESKTPSFPGDRPYKIYYGWKKV